MSYPYSEESIGKIAISGFSWVFFTSKINPSVDSKEDMAFFKSFLVTPRKEDDSRELAPIEQTKKFAWSEFGAKLSGTLFGPCILLLASPIGPFQAMRAKTLRFKLLALFAPLVVVVALPFMLIANLVDLLGSLVKTLIEVCQKDENQNIAYNTISPKIVDVSSK